MDDSTTPGVPAIPVWLEDVSRTAQYLARLSIESAAQAALILRGGKLWAYAGELPQPAAEELARLVTQYWRSNGGGDLARFVRLGADQGDFMLYATSLAGEMILTLVFDVETPFNKIRFQAVKLARALSSPPISEDELARAEVENGPGSRVNGTVEDKPLPSLPPLFTDVPPPSPGQAQGVTGTPVEAGWPFQKQVSGFEIRAGPLPEDDTQPVGVNRPTITGQADLQPDSPAMIELYLACVLIPRLPQHHLGGDLAERLSEWLDQLCLAFGWRLEGRSIRPDYLAWVVRVPPSVTPKSLLRLIRLHTSQRIFDEFPRLKSENPSGDFWAPGYLITSSSQLPATHAIQSFIQGTRQHQGVLRAGQR
jgi:REP element-mobilizing transposase RayT